jgi:small ligand-binding sensory domain FIST
MKYLMIAVLLLGGFVTFAATKEASAVVCAAGVYRAGCVGVRGAAVVRRPVVRRRVY